MAAEKKMEPRLIEEIKRVEAAGQPDRTISIVIEQVGEAAWMASEGTSNDLSELEGEVRAEQIGIRKRLSQLGAAGEIRQLTLSNALAAWLTPAQIREMAGDSRVKLILWNREDQVTA